MATPQEAQAAVTAAFIDHWDDETPVAYENDGFDPTPHPEFARFSFQHIDGSQASLGSLADGVLFRADGVCFVQIFIERDIGTARSNELAERAKSFFETYRGAVWFRNPSPPIPIGVDGSYYQVNVSAQFQYDSIRTG